MLEPLQGDVASSVVSLPICWVQLILMVFSDSSAGHRLHVGEFARIRLDSATVVNIGQSQDHCVHSSDYRKLSTTKWRGSISPLCIYMVAGGYMQPVGCCSSTSAPHHDYFGCLCKYSQHGFCAVYLMDLLTVYTLRCHAAFPGVLLSMEAAL